MKLKIGITLLLALVAQTHAETEISGAVSGVWDRDGSPYIMVDDVTIPNDESLTIQPGVKVQFGEGLIFNIQGALTAVGAEDDSILFKGPEGMVSGSILYEDLDDTLRATYCRFDSLDYAFYGDGGVFAFNNCLFKRNGLSRFVNGSVFLRDNVMDAQIQMWFGVLQGDGLDQVVLERNLTLRTLYDISSVRDARFESNVAIVTDSSLMMPRYASAGWTSPEKVDIELRQGDLLALEFSRTEVAQA